MRWSDIGRVVAKHAPVVGAALGGPGGAAIGSLVSSALGVDPEPGKVAAAIQADPQAALKLAELEIQKAASVRDYKRAILEAELKDTQHARDSHKLSVVPAILVFMMTALVAAMQAMLIYLPVPAENRDVIFTLVGNIMPVWAGCVAYWVGTTRSSNAKDLRPK